MAAPRILFAGNFLVRHWGRGRTGIDMRLMAAATRMDMPSLSFSERDIARFLAPLGFMRNIGASMMNSRFVKTAVNFRPDFIFISHCDYIRNDAIERIREKLPSARIVHINCDPVETQHCKNQIARRMHSCDAIFVTTAGDILKSWTTGKNVVGFFPNPSDGAFECFDNSVKRNFKYDLFFAGRPALADARAELLDRLLPSLDPSVRLGLFGMGRAPLVVGRDYEDALSESKMGLSLNRFENWKWYQSDRITHLMANGILAFQHAGNQMQDFFTDDETVYFSSAEELAEKIRRYNADDAERMRIAAAGRDRYRTMFDARRVLKYMIETVEGGSYSSPYEWGSEVYR